MKRVLAVIALFIFFSLSGLHFVEASQVELTPVELAQPDGIRFVAQPFGDEWYSGYEHDGYTILQDDMGVWMYAVGDADGGLSPSTIRVGHDRTTLSGIIEHLRDHVQLAQTPPHNQRVAQAWEGSSGSQPVLVILVDFTPSTSLGSTAAEWNEAFFDTSAGAKSVKSFYEEASFGAFTVEPVQETQGTANDGVMEVTLNYAHPNTQGSTDTRNRDLTADALIAADADIDFSAYDLDSSGGLDVTELHLIVIPRGYEASFGGASAACTPNVWGHRWSLFPNTSVPLLDGVRVGGFNWGGGYMQFGEWQDTNSGGCPGSGQGNRATIGVMVHELGHDINLPDLYDIDQSSGGIGYWSVMASGSWGRMAGEPSGATPTLPDAFSKMYQGWITPTVVSGSLIGEDVANSAENATVYQLGENPAGVDWVFGSTSGTGEYYLVENRQQIGFDRGLSRMGSAATGLLIWHIDESVTASNNANSNETHRLVDVVEANPTQEMEVSTSRGNLNDVWPGSNGYTVFDVNSTPSNHWYGGGVSEVSVENITVVARGSISADFITSLAPTSVTLHAQSSQIVLVQLLLVSGILLAVATFRVKRQSANYKE